MNALSHMPPEIDAAARNAAERDLLRRAESMRGFRRALRWRTLRADRTRWRLLSGAVANGAFHAIDGAWLDLQALHEDGESDGWVTRGWTSDLAAQCDARFMERFVVAMNEVALGFTAGWTPLPTLAHRVALDHILNCAEQTIDLWWLDVPTGWRRTVERELVERDDEISHDLPDLDQWFERRGQRATSPFLVA